MLKMWSMDYVQVPEERDEVIEETKVEVVEESKEVMKEKKKAELVKQMSLSTTDGGGKDFSVFRVLKLIN